ncbi:MAG TPA: flagellar basal body rod C-terminal domain-containing protein [Actinomycetes bacterium]|nr:flagellar basal body rod C-terminal domain-containing protein [Actinomycetes bacterium]
MFDAIAIAGSGVTVNRKWLDAVSDNIANINTVRPTSGDAFRAKYVVATAVDYGTGTGGTRVAGITLGNPEGRLAYDPTNPLADAEGNVRLPDIDLGSQMTQMLIAQRAYQSNLAVVDRAHDAYQAALQLGRNA